jgi:hypothetical protein
MFCFEINKSNSFFPLDYDMSAYIKNSTNKYLETYSIQGLNIITHNPTRICNIGALIFVSLCSFFAGYKLQGYNINQITNNK